MTAVVAHTICQECVCACVRALVHEMYPYTKYY